MTRQSTHLISFILMTAASSSSADSLERKISLDEVLSSFDASHQLKGYQDAVSGRTTAQMNSTSRHFASPLELSGDGEFGTKDNSERKVTAILKQRILLGIDDTRLKSQFQSEERADTLQAKAQLQLQKIDVAKSYAQLIFQNSMNRIASELTSDIEPLVLKTKIASGRGTISGLAAKKLEILLVKLKSELKVSEQAELVLFQSIASIIKIPALTSSEHFLLAPLPNDVNSNEFHPETNLTYLSMVARQSALTEKSSHVRSLRSFEMGLGASKSFDSKLTAVVVQLAIPIGAGTASGYEANEIESQKKVLEKESELALRGLGDQFIMLQGALTQSKHSFSLAKEREASLEELTRTTRQAFERGQAEILELAESLRELYDAKVKTIELQKDYHENLVTLQLLSQGA